MILMMALNWKAVMAQTNSPDSTKKLNEVLITAWGFQRGNSLRSTGAEAQIGNMQLQNQQQGSMVDAINTAPGVRMEERSPGSYRLSIRGSLIRSPFGIRNIKIYVDDFPLTDAGGNTYLNLIDPASIYSMTLLKGPQSSILGANTGGALLINTQNKLTSNELSFGAGSYGLLHQTAKVERHYQNYHFSIAEGYQQSDGYRENSSLSRKYIQTTHVWDYSHRGELKVFAFYSDLAYKTPGGLTQAQALVDRRAARPATPTLPGAVIQQAGIYNSTFYGGLLNRYDFTPTLQYVIAVFGSTTDFKNPFITNYERRDEKQFRPKNFHQVRTSL
jgi:iron complex outermembrane receptor protein